MLTLWLATGFLSASEAATERVGGAQFGPINRRRRKKKDKPEEYAGRKLNRAIEAALTPRQSVVEVAVEPAPVLPKPETPQPPAPAEVVSAPERVITLRNVSADVLQQGRSIAENRAAMVQSLLARVQARRQALIDEARAELERKAAQEAAEALAQRQAAEEHARYLERQALLKQDEDEATDAMLAIIRAIEEEESKTFFSIERDESGRAIGAQIH